MDLEGYADGYAVVQPFDVGDNTNERFADWVVDSLELTVIQPASQLRFASDRVLQAQAPASPVSDWAAWQTALSLIARAMASERMS